LAEVLDGAPQSTKLAQHGRRFGVRLQDRHTFGGFLWLDVCSDRVDQCDRAGRWANPKLRLEGVAASIELADGSSSVVHPVVEEHQSAVTSFMSGVDTKQGRSPVDRHLVIESSFCHDRSRIEGREIQSLESLPFHETPLRIASVEQRSAIEIKGTLEVVVKIDLGSSYIQAFERSGEFDGITPQFPVMVDRQVVRVG
jgi:hypothetical protein